MELQKNISLRMVLVAVFVAATFGVTGLTAMTLLTESSVLAQNETGGNMTAGNMTGTTNETALYSNQTGMAPETKR